MGIETNKVEWANALLSSIARKIQLNKSEYAKAVDRYYRIAAILTDEHSSIFGLSPVIYPQGSFRTRSTISAHDRDEEFDIDLISELQTRHDADPDQVLGLLYDALLGRAGELRSESIEKKRRCVTVNYAGMHIDITPAVLIDATNPRVVSIFDTHPERPDHAVANPEGFAQWFDVKVLPATILNERTVQANTHPVPDQEPLEDKPLRLQSLQLLKRYRDLTSDARRYDRCPSVLLAKVVALAPATATGGLLGDLSAAASFVRESLDVDAPYEENPRCGRDILTDRWPNGTNAHREFARDLAALLSALQRLLEGGPLEDKQRLLEQLFGERATRRAFDEVTEEFASRARSGGLSAVKGSGAIPAVAGTKASAHSAPIPSHKFYGA